ncbi:MAG: alpha/beta hydrolase [Reichenbachiella sp.]
MKNQSLLFLLFNLASIGVAFSLSPSKEYQKTPHDFHLDYEEVKISTADNYTLNAWHFDVPHSEYLVIISHDGSGNMGEYLERVRIMIRYGFSVLLYDYRGYGSSQDFSIDPLNYIYKEFYTDLEGAVNYSNQNFDKNLILYGWGIGAGISICKAYQMDNIAGIIADDPFVDVYQLKTTFDKSGVIMTIPDNVLKDEFSPLQCINNASEVELRGIKLFHGNKNYLFRQEDINQLYEAVNIENKELYIFDKARHMDNFTVNESEYAREIYVFITNL